MNECAICSLGLTRRFGSFTAVDHVYFEVKPGEIFGFLGPNGSGKSTTIRMLCGILDPTDGTAIVGGYDVRKEPEKVKSVIGYMSQRFSLYDDLTARENLSFFAGIYGVPTAERLERIEEVLTLTGLKGSEDVLVSDLSTGWRQRLALGSAILHKPTILFLDEPTSGVDPISRRRFWDLIYSLTDQGATVLVTTHYMDEAERCNHLTLILDGRIVADGSPSTLKESVITGQILRVSCLPVVAAVDVLSGVPGVKEVTLYGTSVHAVVDDAQSAVPELRAALEKAGVECSDIKQVSPTLEDVFAAVMQRAGKDSPDSGMETE